MATKKELLLGCALIAGCSAFVARDIFFPADPTVPNAQLQALAREFKAGQTRAHIEELAKRYDTLTTYGGKPERLFVATPRRFGADNWQAIVYFGEDGRVLSVDFGTVDTTPLAPHYPTPPGMPSNMCFGSSAQCASQ